MARIDRNEKDIQSLWEEINGMKKMFIIGMAGLLLNGITLVSGVILVIAGKIQINF